MVDERLTGERNRTILQTGGDADSGSGFASKLSGPAMITGIYIQNFRIFSSFSLQLNDDLNILVGDNEAGKSTILEAIALALTKRIGGRQIEFDLSPYIFNKECTTEYLAAVREGNKPELPKILVELYLRDDLPELQYLRGNNNSQRLDAVGVKVEILFDPEYADEYGRLLADDSEMKVVPAEYYKVNWYSFANNAVTARSLPISVFYIDATTIRLQSGADFYVQNIISDGLPAKERVALAVAYRKLKEKFSGEASIQGINKGLSKGAITEKDLSISLDISQRASWETNLVPLLDELPFQLTGKGEQTALKIMLALDRKATDCNVVLIEEPENHLSFSSMSKLVAKISERCAGKQIVLTTHSTYVLNKLGLEKLLLLHGAKTTSLSKLPPDTYDYFKKLSGYDTLRLILAKQSILVEGPSDELIVQRAYKNKHGKLPLEDGVDVINVRGLSHARFLDIAKELGKEVAVVTDNDGDYQKKVADKYAQYSAYGCIRICADRDDSVPTLEPQFVKANGVQGMNKILGTTHADAEGLIAHMANAKTSWALKVFETAEPVVFPDYINDAVG